MSDDVYLIGEQNFTCKRREYVALGTNEGRHIALALTASGIPFDGKVSDVHITFAYDADYKEEVDEIIKKATSEKFAEFHRELNENYQGEKCMHFLPAAAEMLNMTEGTLRRRPLENSDKQYEIRCKVSVTGSLAPAGDKI